MFSRSTIFAFLAVLLAAQSGGEAEGAFIALDFDVASEFEGQMTSPTGPIVEQELEQSRSVLHAASLYQRTGKGMSSGMSVSTSSGTAGIAMTVPPSAITGGKLVTLLVEESRCRVPSPLLSGVFRPPRTYCD